MRLTFTSLVCDEAYEMEVEQEYDLVNAFCVECGFVHLFGRNGLEIEQ